MPGVPRRLIEHSLNVDPKATPNDNISIVLPTTDGMPLRRMCADYTDLNKHCPKDPFGLPQIDQVIDSTAGCDLLCFLDYYSEYHQIAIKEGV
jgi:hypothetical protein